MNEAASNIFLNVTLLHKIYFCFAVLQTMLLLLPPPPLLPLPPPRLLLLPPPLFLLCLSSSLFFFGSAKDLAHSYMGIHTVH